MNIKTTFWAIATVIASVGIHSAAHADTVNARCDIYPLGEDQASAVTACTFSQRQGAVGIQLANGRRYDFAPSGSQPGNFVDQNGNAAYRQAGLGDRGLIFQTSGERIFVYWDTAGVSSGGSSFSSTPVANRPSGNGGFVTLSASDPGSRINLRSQATIDSLVEGYGIPGDRVQLLQCVQDHDSYNSTLNWCQVQFPRSRAVGWIRSDFIIFEDAGE
ncbi:MAG: SH3 domain-containing protein [Elainellaceae cyanobacterium]